MRLNLILIISVFTDFTVFVQNMHFSCDIQKITLIRGLHIICTFCTFTNQMEVLYHRQPL